MVFQRVTGILMAAAILAISGAAAGNAIAADDQQGATALVNIPGLPPAAGPETPSVIAKKGEDALYHQSWFVNSFLNLRDDFNDAKAKGKRFAIIFEQRGCIYCVKMHTDTLAKKYINDYARENFAIVQLNLWGDREVTDFDGKVFSEKKLGARWGVMFTPTIVFFKDDIGGLDGKFGQPLEVIRLNQVGAGTFYDMLAWVKHKIHDKEPNFQRFHIERINQRLALKGARTGTDGRALTPGKPTN